MKLVKLRVKNFRGIGGDRNSINFTNSNVIFLIGPNNSGKSTFLHAYEYFVAPKQKALVSDFFKNDTNTPIEIEADFLQEEDDVDSADFSAEPEWISKWVQEKTGLITIKKEWSNIDSEFIKYTKDKSGNYVKNGFGGFETLLKKYAPTAIFINAIETVESLEKKINSVIENEHLKKIQDEYSKEYGEAIAAVQKIQDQITSSESIRQWNENINKGFQKVFPGLTLEISAKDYDKGIDIVKSFKTNHSIDVKKDGVDRKETFERHGHGVIRQALFNFFTYVQINAVSRRKEYLLLFEEPELFLHPKSTRLLREELYELASDSPFQILCCTHCPQMIDISKPHCSLVRIVKNNKTEMTSTCQVGDDVFQDTENKEFVQMLNRFDPNVCETFYSTRVCLVEGDTEAIVCREILRSKYPESDVFVLNTGSKNNMPFFQRILRHFSIPYVVIHDADTRLVYANRGEGIPKFNKDGSPKSNSAWSLNLSIWNEICDARLHGIDAHRLVSVYEFESANGYKHDSSIGKPLSAYEFASKSEIDTTMIGKQIKEVVDGKYSKEWSNMEFDSIQEPHDSLRN